MITALTKANCRRPSKIQGSILLGRAGLVFAICLTLAFLLPLSAKVWAASAEGPYSKGALIAVIPEDGPPSFFRDKKTGEAAGFAVELTNEVARRAGFTVTYQFADNWNTIRERIQSGGADLAPGLAISAERAQYYDYSQPFDIQMISMFGRLNSSGLKRLPEGCAVGVLRGSVAYDLLSARADIKLTPYDNFETGLFELLAGKIMAFAGPTPVLWRLAQEAGLEDHIEVIGQPFAEIQRAFGVKKGRTELVAQLNAALTDFVGSPEYNKIYVKWYGKPRPSFVLSHQTLWTVSLFFLLIVGLAAWRHRSVLNLTRRLHREIQERRILEEATRLNEERLRLALASSQLAWFDLDIPTGAAKVSPDYPKILGYAPDEFDPNLQTWSNGLHPEDQGPVMEKFKECLSTGQAGAMEYRRQTKTGAWKWLRSVAQVIKFDPAGNPLRMIGIHADISAQKIAESSLRESEALYRELFEAESDAIVMVDNLSGRIIAANQATSAMYGYSHEELLAKKNSDLSAEPEDTRKVTQGAEMRSGQIVMIPLRFHRKKDGTVFPVEITGRFFTHQERAVHIAAIRDITVRRQAEKEREQYFRFFQTSADVMVIADPHGAFLKTNQASTVLLGYSEAELVAKPFIDFIHPDDKQSTLDEMARQVELGSSLNFENRYLCKDGSFKWLSWRAIFIKEEGITYATARDITEQKQMEAELREAKERFELLFSSSPDAALISQIDDGTITNINEVFTAVSGYSRQELLGNTTLNLKIWGEEVRQRFVAELREKGFCRNLEFQFRRKDGSTFFGSVSATLAVLHGVPHIVSNTRDITEFKRSAAEISRSLQEKEVLLKEIHHRVKNNMQVIYSLLDLQAKSVVDPEIRAMFEESRNRVISMALIHENLYRSDDLAHIDFNNYLRGLIAGIAETYKQPGVALIIDDSPLTMDINCGIPCGLIVNELVSNAMKYGFPGGRSGEIHLGISKNSAGDNVLTVADNGIGFPAAVDFRNTTSIGLQIVNVLTSQIHGTLELQSQGGSKFTITFPGSSPSKGVAQHE